MIRRPPRSTLFPTRRSSDLNGCQMFAALRAIIPGTEHWPRFQRNRSRSEEHTSELQSQFHLVCRLLLEKKKIKININEKRIIKTEIKSMSRVVVARDDLYGV